MSGTPVCETVTGRDMAELLAARDGASRADLVELRLDGVADVDVAGAIVGRTRPVIVTCRPVWEGGRFDGAEEDRLALLGRAIRLGAEFVDVEWKADRRTLPRAGSTRVVLSHHVFDAVPNDLADRVRAMRQEHADVVKLAIATERLRDCLALHAAVAGPGERVAVGMGAAGLFTRVHPAWFSSSWTYAGSAEPGQIAASQLLDAYGVGRTSAATAVYGIVGTPLGHSASPAMHNAAFAEMKIDALYVPLTSDDPDDVVAFVHAVGLRGASVTAPLKTGLGRRSTPVDEPSRQTGVVNTLRWMDGVVEGRNFDVDGFMAPLIRRSVPLAGCRAVVLGAGGAARAAAWALRSAGARVEVSARRHAQAVELADALEVKAVAWPPAADWSLLVNATPIGTWPDVDASPLAEKEIRGERVYDLVYNPQRTRLIELAGALGLETIGGLEMLVEQAALQGEWWTGRQPARDTLERAALEFLTTDRWR